MLAESTPPTSYVTVPTLENSKLGPNASMPSQEKNKINEDYLIFCENIFYAVFDGLGGNGNGQIASKLVAETVKESILKSKSISEAVQEAEKKLSAYNMFL